MAGAPVPSAASNPASSGGRPPPEPGTEPPAKRPRLDEAPLPSLTPAPAPAAADDEDDLLKSGWMYLDKGGQRQGPFTLREMAQWYAGGFFPDTTPCRRVTAAAFQPIGSYPEMKRPLPPLPGGARAALPVLPVLPVLPSVPMMPGMLPGAPASSEGDYAQKAFFTRYQGRFTKYDETTHFTARGLKADKDGRDLGKFLDADQYQEEMLQKQESGELKKRPPKLTKAQVEFFKQRRRLQKVRRILSDDE